jgi:hypothetical protein
MELRVLLLSLVISARLCPAQGRPELVEEVRSGGLKEAKASWWGFDAGDATAALQAAVRSGVPKLTVDNVGKPWIVRPIRLESNQEILFEKGVVVEAKRGEFKGRNDCLFSISQKENVVLCGYGATLRMHRADYDDPAQYEKAEWRHVLSIRSSKNVEVQGLTLALSGGDGIYLGVSKRGVPDENIVIKDVVCDRNYRQGISVIAAHNLLIENTVMKNTGGTPPQAGIDFEPNHASEELVNCVMRDCVSEGNAGSAYTFYLPNLRADSAPISIRLENCVARDCGRNAFAFATGNSEAEAVAGRIDVVGCRFERCAHSAVLIRRKPVGGVEMQFRNCVIDTPSPHDADTIPVVMLGKVGCRRSVGGVNFGNLLLIDPVERPFFNYEDWMGGRGVESVTGTFRVRRDKTETVQPLTKEWLTGRFPPRTYKQIPPLALDGVAFVPAGRKGAGSTSRGSPVFLRRRGTFAVYAEEGDTVSLTLDYAQVGRYAGRPMKVIAETPSGKRIRAGTVAFETEGKAGFSAPESGLYRIPFDAGANRAALTGSSHPAAISAEESPVAFIRPAGDLYFLVPAGTGEFGLLVYGDSKSEAVRATIFDPSGRQVWEKDRITLPEMFAPERATAREDEVWRLRLSRPTGITCEDYCVELRGIPPFLAQSPEALLKAQ